MRIGFGYDIHPLILGRKLILGGEIIPYQKGLDGHSDADVLIHSLIDALLGAAGEGDIGQHFPDNDEQYKEYQEKVAENINKLFKEMEPLWSTAGLESRYEMMSRILAGAKSISAKEMKIGEIE